ncbi:protein PRRC1-like [Copidosoma floridanum]|uniref:protein PRRC1-like n=1 Tax=Copidosoma floridanum TaxID=29053 RepID=UPI000C6F8D98|nr:protein PRRC1-like [Copidosoma floridanum]
MTDESNGESSFEFVDKKLEDCDASNATAPGPVLSAPASTGNLLSNVAPPSALPTFVTSSAQNVPSTTPEAVKPPSLQLPQGVQTAEPKAVDSPTDKGPVVLIAPDSPTMDTGALAGSLFSWVKDTVANSSVLSKVAEKAKSSVNSMITTLDPQMHSGGDIEIIVASDKDVTVSPVREAFQNVFGNATVKGAQTASAFETAQPVGFEAGIKAAQERIIAARNTSLIPADIPVVAVENFLLEIGHNKWFDLGVIILEDLKQNINLQTFTQMTPVPSQIVETAKETPSTNIKSGLTVTIDSLMGATLQASIHFNIPVI